ISAVRGPCAGAGMSVALSADMIVASETAFFLQAFKAIGLVPDAGVTYFLPRIVGRARAMELSMLGERLDAAKALEWGVVNRVVADAELESAAGALAKNLAAGPTKALALTRDLYWRSEASTYEEQLNNERWAQRAASRTEDSDEGVRAFIEKRPTRFTGS
ncbi:MAG: enoyl-CoA hydratase-related protein, partial [Pseudomonadota bacterium]